MCLLCKHFFQVLSCASDYFSAMFSHDMLEKDQPVVELQELGPEGFTQLLDYFYHGHLTLTPDCIEDILEAARFFQVLRKAFFFHVSF